MKSSLLVNHFWCTWLDFMVCTLSTPYVFLPTTVFSGVGILSSLEIPFTPQLATGVFSVVSIGHRAIILKSSAS
ncbi:hypothetical protein L5515_006410 [Caenorhabditis briggsae]|uniref:Uncharacterized protein n=1 Tax=Caenorhabditis briggsae TaxID=6238 RepID=A0AAE9EVV5_CAEBR|nr:hypothetical protein L5515_006410 [Caenorhabditis briggsae]